MTRAGAALALLLATRALGADRYAVVAVAEPPAGPDAELAELAHQLRAACRDRVAGVLEAPELRARLLGQSTGATLPELERAHAAAQAAFRDDDLDVAAAGLRGVVDELERLPGSAPAHALWTQALVRLAYVHKLRKDPGAMRALLERLAASVPGYVVDEVQYPPSLRREFDEARWRVLARPRGTLAVTSRGRAATVLLDGREVGRTPLSLALPPGRYRVGGADGAVRVPDAWVEIGAGRRALDLDLALAEALRVDAGPGLAVAAAERASMAARAGGWLGASRVVTVSGVSAGGGQLLEAALHEVEGGAVVRQARVRMTAGAVPAAQLGALAAFLLTGQPARGVEPIEPRLSPPALPTAVAAPPPRPPRAGPSRPWLRPAACGAGAVALGLAGFATWQALEARNDSRVAASLMRPDGALVTGTDPARYDQIRAAADASRRNAYLGAAGAALFAAAAGVLGYLAWDDRGGAVVRF